jgi:hypothetical protein
MENKIFDDRLLRIVDLAVSESPFCHFTKYGDTCIDPNFMIEMINSGFLDDLNFKNLLPADLRVCLNVKEFKELNDLMLKTNYHQLVDGDVGIEMRDLIKIAIKSKAPIILLLEGIKRPYYMSKQLSFSFVNFFHAWRLQRAAKLLALSSSTGAASFNIGAVLAVSFLGGMALSIVEQYVPTGHFKTIIRGCKFVVALPTEATQYVINFLTEYPERLLFGHQLPINVTAELGLLEGPLIKDMTELTGNLTQFVKFVRKKADVLNKFNK